MNNHHRSSFSSAEFIYQIPFCDVQLSILLGRGSYGSVHKGVWKNHKVAVKVYENKREVESFKNELQRLSQIRHKNIVRLYGSSISSQPNQTKSYLIMELSDRSLHNLLHEAPDQSYHLGHAAYWAYQAANGVAYLHDFKPKPLIHRDLKPENLLLFDRGKILKICDFGTAVPQKTQMTNNTGSICYMAPEVFKTDNYDQRCDVFSWSIIFWEILARKQPYHDLYDKVHSFSILLMTSNQGLRPPELKLCPPMIWRLIVKCWDNDPEKRPYMKDVIEKMRIILHFAGVSANRSSNDRQRNHYNDNNVDSQPSNIRAREDQSPLVDPDAKTRARNHLSAQKYRLNLVREACHSLELQGQDNTSSSSPRSIMSEFEETQELNNTINSLRAQLRPLVSQAPVATPSSG